MQIPLGPASSVGIRDRRPGARSGGTAREVFDEVSTPQTTMTRASAQRLFAKQEPREKRRLLNFVLSNCTWEDGEVVATFSEPFDMLAQTASNSARLGRGETFKSAKTEIWLGN